MDEWSWIFLIGGIIIGGVAVYLFLKPQGSSPVYGYKVAPPAYENVESWEMWEDETGRLHAEVHRKVHPSE